MKSKQKGKARTCLLLPREPCLAILPLPVPRRGESPAKGQGVVTRLATRATEGGDKRTTSGNGWLNAWACFFAEREWPDNRSNWERGGQRGRGQLMDGVAQQGSEVMRAVSELIGDSVHIHFLLLAYSWVLRESPGVEAGFIHQPRFEADWRKAMKLKSEIRTLFFFFFLQDQLTRNSLLQRKMLDSTPSDHSSLPPHLHMLTRH